MMGKLTDYGLQMGIAEIACTCGGGGGGRSAWVVVVVVVASS